MKKEYTILRGTCGDFIKKAFVVLLSAYGFGLSMAITLKANVGVDPITLMMDGGTKFFGINFTVANWAVSGICILLMLLFNRRGIHAATVIMLLLIGVFCDLNNWIIAQIYPGAVTSFPIQMAMAIFGFIILGVFIGSYLPMDLGNAPTDGVVRIIFNIFSKKFPKFRYDYAMYIMYIISFCIGWVLGGAWGVGTLIGLFIPGYVCNKVMPYFEDKWPKWLHFDKKLS